MNKITRNPRPLVIEQPVRCPRCQHHASRVQSTHRANDGENIRRYRRCLKCGRLYVSQAMAF